jgi:hypothetical protein
VRPAGPLELGLEDVATAVDHVVGDRPFDLAHARPIEIVELLHDLERPPPLEDVAADDLVAHQGGPLRMAGRVQLLGRLLEEEIGPADELMDVVEPARARSTYSSASVSFPMAATDSSLTPGGRW